MPLLILGVIVIAVVLAYFALLGWLLFTVMSLVFLPLLCVAALAAFVLAAMMPIILLTGGRWREARDHRLRSPEDVQEGKVLGPAPRGETSRYGWDSAWPTYFPFQARRDFGFVAGWMWHRSRQFFVLPLGWAGTLWRINRGILRWALWVPVIVTMMVTIGIPSWIFATLLTVFSAVFIAALWVVMAVATALSRLFGAGYSGAERYRRRHSARQLRCPNRLCYRTTDTPGFVCPTCGEVHRSLRPGPLGIFRRICGCGMALPTTATRAARRRLAVVCPYCSANLAATAGARPTALVPVIGPVAAGKTTLFASAVQGMTTLAEERDGKLGPSNDPARRFVRLVSAGGVLPKTADASRPEVMTFDVALDGKEYEVQLVDAAGERFVTQETTDSLTYIDASDAWVFVLDPLMLPEVRARLDENAIRIGSTQVGAGDLASAYQSVIERFKAINGTLKGKSLAIVVTKADLLVKVPDWSDLGSSESVKEMLVDSGAHNLVQSAEFDFRNNLEFFVTEAQTREALDPRRDPVRVIDWAISRCRVRLRFLREAKVGAERTAPVTTTIGE